MRARRCFVVGLLCASVASGASAGYLVGGQCVAGDVAAAIQLDCLRNYPQSSVRADGVHVRIACESAGGGDALMYVQALDPSTGQTQGRQYVTQPVFGACDETSDYSDYTEVWGLAIVALATVWAMRNVLFRLFWGSQ